MHEDKYIKKLHEKVNKHMSDLMFKGETKARRKAFKEALNAYHRALEENEEKTKAIIGNNRAN